MVQCIVFEDITNSEVECIQELGSLRSWRGELRVERLAQEEFGRCIKGHAEKVGLKVDINESREGIRGGQGNKEILKMSLEESGVFRIDLFEGGPEETLGTENVSISIY